MSKNAIKTASIQCVTVITILIASAISSVASPRAPHFELAELVAVTLRETFDAPFFAGNSNAQVSVSGLGTLRESWSGYSLQRLGSVTPFVIPGVNSSSGRTNLFTAASSVRFWFMPYWSSESVDKNGTPGYEPHLLDLMAVNGQQSAVVWSLRVSTDGNALALVNGDGNALVETQIGWTAGEWHQLVVTHGSQGTELVVDGVSVGTGAATVVVPPSVARLVVGSGWDGSGSAGGELDEVLCFRKPLRAAFNYEALKRQASLGPVTETELSAKAMKSANKGGSFALMESESEEGGGGMAMMMMGGSSSACVTNGPVYLTNVVCSFTTNEGWTVYFDIMGGETNAGPYDIFSTPQLAGGDVTNSVWWWLEQGNSCETHWFTNQPTNGMFYILTLPGADRDADGLYDGWEWKHFGTLQQSAAGDYDGDGTSNGDAYTNGYSPNNLAFELVVTNRFVRSASVPVWLNLAAGVPAGMAVLVDDTNQAAASWSSYAANFTVNIPAVEGWHEVRVGLRGHWNENVVWRTMRMKYDVTAPFVAVTGPAGGTVSQPLLQLKGYGNEPLSGVIYDLNNAAGMATNQAGFVTRQSYNTNGMEFTTNWFQCFDLRLADGTNLVTVRIADLAGNTASTNVTWTLDGSGDTVAPVIGLLWPGGGMRLIGEDFTANGWMDDPSATITAFLVDSNGVTNAVTGTVGRSGEYWVENVPLGGGTNQLYLTATDHWGNSSVTNLTLIKSDIGLTMEALTRQQMAEFTATVTGTINQSNQDVWVNGVPAVVNNGGWQADNVPVRHDKTVALHIKTVPPGSNPDTTPGTGELRAVQDAPPLVEMTGYHRTLSGNVITGTGFQIYHVVSSMDVNWEQDQGGSYNNHVRSEALFFPDLTDCTVSATLPPTLEELNRGFPASDSCNGAFTMVLTPPAAHEAMSQAYSIGNITWRTDAETALNSNEKDAPGEVGTYLVKVFVSDGILPSQVMLHGRPLVASATDPNVGEVMVQVPKGSSTVLTPRVPDSDNYSWHCTVEEVKAGLVADANRDGIIDGQDEKRTTAINPFRFWINDDKDDGDVADGDSDIPGANSGANYNNAVVNGRCDVIDFFPVWLSLSNVLQQLPLTNGYTYRLAHAAGAVNFVYTDLFRTNAFDYLTTLATNGYGSSFDKGPHEADTIHVTAAGVELSADFLNRCLTNGNKGVILVEGRIPSTSPLMLDIWLNNKKLAGIPLHLSLSGVEQMYRWVNLRHAVGDSETRATDLTQPANYPDAYSNGKNFVFVHGYNVTEIKARYWNAEMFKRLWQSGSRAKFYAVDWHGNKSYLSLLDITPDYHTNVVNAFLTAPALKDFLTDLTGETTVAGHSLGNMVCLSAISDWNAAPTRYFMIDAAAPIEAIDDGAGVANSMVHPEWADYTNQLWASEWHALFASNDGRNSLSWRGRLANFGSVNVYNYYSSGEEVLREHIGTPPAGLLDTLYQNALNYFAGQSGVFAWAWQEKTKGRMAFNGVSGSDHGGWKFNLANGSGYDRFVNGLRVPIAPEDAALVPPEQLRTNAFFDLGNYTFSNHPDLTYLPTASGSDYAYTNRNRILADAIPALTLPIGANPVPRLSPPQRVDERNINMQGFQNGWPARPALEVGKWHHSDIRDIAYPYNHRIFDEFVNRGNLKN